MTIYTISLNIIRICGLLARDSKLAMCYLCRAPSKPLIEYLKNISVNHMNGRDVDVIPVTARVVKQILHGLCILLFSGETMMSGRRGRF